MGGLSSRREGKERAGPRRESPSPEAGRSRVEDERVGPRCSRSPCRLRGQGRNRALERKWKQTPGGEVARRGGDPPTQVLHGEQAERAGADWEVRFFPLSASQIFFLPF